MCLHGPCSRDTSLGVSLARAAPAGRTQTVLLSCSRKCEKFWTLPLFIIAVYFLDIENRSSGQDLPPDLGDWKNTHRRFYGGIATHYAKNEAFLFLRLFKSAVFHYGQI